MLPHRRKLKRPSRHRTAVAGEQQRIFSFEKALNRVASTSGLFGTDTENFTLDAVSNRIAHSKVTGAWQYDANNLIARYGFDPLDRRIWKEQYKTADGQALAQLDIISRTKPRSWEFLKRLPKLEWAAFDGDMVWENGECTKKSSKHKIQLESDPNFPPIEEKYFESKRIYLCIGQRI